MGSFAYIAPSADIHGEVLLGNEVSIWYQAVIRTEVETITIGSCSNIQDCCVLHTDAGFPITIGKGVTVGHGAIIHGCSIGDNSLIGMGAILLNGASIGKNCIIGAGALVTSGMVIPDGSLAFGNPAKVIRPLTEEEIAENTKSALHYAEHGKEAFGSSDPSEPSVQETVTVNEVPAEAEEPDEVERARTLLALCKTKQREQGSGIPLTYKLQLHDDVERVAKLVKTIESGKAKPKHMEALSNAIVRLETSMNHIFESE